MKAFIPIDITDAMLVSSTVAEPDAEEPSYNAATTYAEFAQASVITANSHLVYESLVSGNVGNPVTDETKWILKGKTNRYRMFDWNQGNPSVGASPMTVVIRPGKRISAIMLEGLKASTVDITITDGIGGPVAFTLDGYLLVRQVTTYYEYFFAPFVYDKVVATFEVPPVTDPVITVTLTDPSGVIEVSRFATGLDTYLGAVEKSNPVVDSDNYSEITYDPFGHATLNPIPSIPTTDQKLFCKSSRLNVVRQFKDQANAKAVVWSGLDDIEHDYQEALVLIGVYQNFQIDLSDPNYPVINLTLKGI